jgi:16S rRNA (guanine527-N7)-methyltransferase
MRPDRIAELLEPYLAPFHSESIGRRSEETAVVSAAQLECISTYIDLLTRWNARINLTAIRNETEIVTRHFGESIFAARCLFPGCEDELQDFKCSLADVGSGAGFPGIPIKIWSPRQSVTLIEANHKKAAFLREVARTITLTDVDILNVRAETVSQTFDIVTVRAVERIVETLPIAYRILASGGRLALLISSSLLDQARKALPDLTWKPQIPIPGSKSRLLLVGYKKS